MTLPKWRKEFSCGAMGAGLLLCATLILDRAWVTEDAYIPFRVIDNFMHGYGLRWNIDERVQAYTNPLWMLLHIPFYALWGNIFIVTIVLCLLCSITALGVVAATFRTTPWGVLIFFAIPLAASLTFTEYATSGLETPMLFLLFSLFGFVLWRPPGKRFWLWVSLITAGAMLTRLDAGVFYLPALAWLIATRRREVRWRQMALGLSPLAAWLAFSLFYYGFLFPNTKYAKINTGIAWSEYFSHGLDYLYALIVYDLTGFLLLSGTLLSLTLHLLLGRHPRRALLLMLCFCLWLFCLYIIAVGGDWMAGRFWAFPIFVAAWLLAADLGTTLSPRGLAACAAMAGLVIALSAAIQFYQNDCKCILMAQHVLSARSTFRSNGLFISTSYRIRTEPQYTFVGDGKALAAKGTEAIPPIYARPFVGLIGFYAGPHTIIIDLNALADPLLARLPAKGANIWMVGHYGRKVPEGYAKALQTGSLTQMNPSLAKYYARLHLITSGDLMSFERLKTIVAFNLGAYDTLRDAYLDSIRKP